MNRDNTNCLKVIRKAVFTYTLAGIALWTAGLTARGETAASDTPPALSADLQEVATLAQSHMSDDVIISFINKSGKTYKPGVSDIIALNKLGVSQNVITALLQSKSATPSQNHPPAPVSPPQTGAASPPASPAASTGETPQDAPQVNFQYFHDQLTPYGTWVEVSGMGQVWKPSDAITGISPNWRPYYDNGQWVHTDNGLFWQSDYTWGDIPFHYGRWSHNAEYGWVWAPDYTWGPSWVCWRQAEEGSAIGWASSPSWNRAGRTG